MGNSVVPAARWVDALNHADEEIIRLRRPDLPPAASPPPVNCWWNRSSVLR